MKAKAKAKEIIEKFIEPTKVPNIKGIWVKDIDGAKQCALIAVDEVFSVFNDTNGSDVRLYYWQEVRQEIEKM